MWPDTGGYLAPVNIVFRSMFYSLAIYPFHLTGSLWPVIFLQSLLTAYLVRLLLREVFGLKSRAGFLNVIALLCIFTSLPWYTGFLMPDIFTPILVMGLFLMAFCFDRLNRGEQCYVAGVTLVSAVVHNSHTPVLVGLLITGFVARALLRGPAPSLMPHLMLPAMITIIGIVAIVLSNYLTLGIPTFSAGGYAFELARLQADGPAVGFLRESCRIQHYELCRYLDRMPMENWRFLWSSDGPMRELGWLEERKEGSAIVNGTIQRYPLWVLRTAIKNTIGQLIRFETAGGLISYSTSYYPTRDIQRFYPADFAEYQDSRQSRGELTNLHGLVGLHVAVVVVSVMYCLLFAVRCGRKENGCRSS